MSAGLCLVLDDTICIMDWRWLGLISIVVIIATAATPLFGGQLDWRDSLSRSWTGSRRTWLIMAAIMSVAGTGVCTSLALWAIPYYQLPAIMYGIIGVAYAAFMGVAWMPMAERPGEHSYWHGHFLAGSIVATLAFVAMAVIVCVGKALPPIAWVVCALSMILTAGWPLLFFKPARRIFLPLESLIATTFLGGNYFAAHWLKQQGAPLAQQCVVVFCF